MLSDAGELLIKRGEAQLAFRARGSEVLVDDYPSVRPLPAASRQAVRTELGNVGQRCLGVVVDRFPLVGAFWQCVYEALASTRLRWG